MRSASAASPSDQNDIFNSRFTVTNEGYLEVDRAITGCYISKSRNAAGGTLAKALIADNPPVDLHQLESVTVPCSGPHIFLEANKADLMLVSVYTVSFVSFLAPQFLVLQFGKNNHPNP